MKKYKFIIGSIFFIAIIAFNVSVHSDNPYNDISISEVEMLSAAADAEDWAGKAEQGCMRCGPMGSGLAIYYCIGGQSTCFQADCVGGIC